MFIDFINQFTHRDIATLFWLLIIFVFLITKKEIKQGFLWLFNRQSLSTYLIFFLIVFFFFFFLSIIWIWDFSLLKDTIFFSIWFLIPLFLNIEKIDDWKKHIQEIFKEYISFLFVFSFFINLQPLPLFWEILLQPILVIFYWWMTVDDVNKENQKVKSFASIILSVIVGSTIIFSVTSIIKNDIQVMTLQNFKSFLLPIILTILSFPILYLLRLYMVYEDFYVSIKTKGNIDLQRFVLRKVFEFCWFNLYKLNNFISSNHFFIEDKESIINMIKIANQTNIKTQIDNPYYLSKNEYKEYLEDFMFECWKWDLDTVKKYIDSCPNNIDTIWEDTKTWLMWASLKWHLHVVKFLIEQWADVNMQDEQWWTALFDATMNWHFEVVKFLLEHWVDKNIKDQHETTALDYAKSIKNEKIIELLK